MLLFATGLIAAVVGLPDWRLRGFASGDEPKYLRIAWSLYHDLDADVSSNQQGPLTATVFGRNLRRLAGSTREATASLLRGDTPPADHTWGLGNWTVAAWHGGAYHAQGPGLGALLAPALGLAASEDAAGVVPRAALVVLALFLATAFTQTALLAGEASDSRPAGAIAASAVFLSPALFIGGFHLYPETAAVAVVPWLARHACPRGPAPGPARVLAFGLVAGSLVWLHVKFLLLCVVSVAALAARVRRRRLVALAGAGALVPLAAWLLFVHQLTGLLRPDALYVRFGSEVWRGDVGSVAWRFVGGLANGLFGARDGIFIMAPAAAVAALGVPWLWRRDRRAAVILLAVFASVWCAAALHGGGAPGPPGRLLAPAAPLLAVPLAIGLQRLGSRLAFRWSIIAAVLTSLVAIAAMQDNVRLTVNPYRGLIAPATDLRQDLPSGRSHPSGAISDLARAGLLLTAIAFWALRFSREAATAGEERAAAAGRGTLVWREAVSFQIGAWLTLALAATALQALTTLSGG